MPCGTSPWNLCPLFLEWSVVEARGYTGTHTAAYMSLDPWAWPTQEKSVIEEEAQLYLSSSPDSGLFWGSQSWNWKVSFLDGFPGIVWPEKLHPFHPQIASSVPVMFFSPVVAGHVRVLRSFPALSPQGLSSPAEASLGRGGTVFPDWFPIACLALGRPAFEEGVQLPWTGNLPRLGPHSTRP